MNEEYILNRMDAGFKEVRDTMATNHAELSEKILDLQKWRFRIVGGAVVAGGLMGFVVEFCLKLLK